MTSDRDRDLVRLAVDAGLISSTRVAEREREAREVRALGLDVSVADLLEQKGDLTREQIEELLETARERRAKEARAAERAGDESGGNGRGAGGSGSKPAQAVSGRLALPPSGTETGIVRAIDGAVPVEALPPLEELAPGPSDSALERGTPRGEQALSGTGPAPIDTGIEPWRPSRRLRGYRLAEEIGRGAMGIVYRAVQEGLDRPVALKVLPETLGLDAVARGRFLEEARAAAALNHPGIVPVIEAGEEDGVHFFAMELVPGPTLKKLVEDDGALDPIRAARLCAQCARALDYAHDEGVIHRDVKPHNIIVTVADNDEQAVLTDFGLAKRTDAGGASFTRPGTVVGTPIYMSPEQALLDGPPVDPRTDVYSLGVTLYEVAVGAPPFDPEGEVTGILEKVVYEDPHPPRRRRPDLPRDHETVIMRAMEKEPGRRYESCSELAADLERFCRGEPVRARPVGTIERAFRVVRRHPGRIASIAAILISVPAAILTVGEVTRRVRAREALLEAAVAYAEGEHDACEAALDRAAEERPEWSEVWVRRARLESARGRGGRALEALDRALALEPDRVDALIQRGEARRSNGAADGAAEDFERARRIDPTRPGAALGLARIALVRGEAEEARALAHEALALAVEEAALAGGRPEGELLGTIKRVTGEALLALGRPEDALGDLREAALARPSDDTLLLLAQTRLALGLAREAREALDTLLARDPENARAYEARARARAGAGQVGQALDDAERAIALGWERARLLRGRLRFESIDAGPNGAAYDLQGAIADLEAALALPLPGGLASDERVDALLLRARASDVWTLRTIGRTIDEEERGRIERLYREAIEEGDRQLAAGTAPATDGGEEALLTPAVVNRIRDLTIASHLALGRFQFRSGRVGPAGEEFNRVATLAKQGEADPARVYDGLVGQARVALAQNEDQRAGAALAEALDLDGDRPDAYRLRAVGRRRAGDEDEALEDFRRAFVLDATARDDATRFYAGALEVFEQVSNDPTDSRRFAQRMTRAEALLFRASEARTGFAEATWRRARTYHFLGRDEESLVVHRRALAENPACVMAAVDRAYILRDFEPGRGFEAVLHELARAQNAAGDSPMAAHVVAVRAETLRQDGPSFDAALAEAEAGLDLADRVGASEADRYVLDFERAQLLTRLRKNEDAQALWTDLEDRRKTITGNRRDASLFVAAADAAEDRDAITTARLFLDRALTTDPSYGLAYRKRGSISWQVSQLNFPDAFIDMITAADLDPSLAEPFFEVEGRLGPILRLFPMVANRVDEIVDANPVVYSSYFLRSYVRYHQGRYDEARNDLLKARELKPDFYLIETYLGAAELGRGDLDAAEAALDHALAVAPATDFGLIHYWYACLEAKRGDDEKAIEHLQNAWTGGFTYPDRIRDTPELAKIMNDVRIRRLLGRTWR